MWNIELEEVIYGGELGWRGHINWERREVEGRKKKNNNGGEVDKRDRKSVV